MGTINVLVKDSGAGNAPISNVFVVLYDVANNTSTQAQTNASGQVTFATLPAGSYSVYNTGIDTTGENPPTQCGFPDNYTGTITPRRLDFTLATATITIANFFYDTPIPWSTLNGGNPPSIAITTNGTTGTGVNLATGATSPLPAIVNNGIGYSLADNMLYGNALDTRTAVDGNVTLQLPHNYGIFNNIGDCDLDSYFYGFISNTSFMCVDVNPYRTTYLRPLNPYLGFQEVFTTPYAFTVTGATSPFVGADYSYVDAIKGLVQGTGNSRIMWVLSLTTPKSYNIPITGTALSVNSGSTFSDSKNFYTPTGSQIIKYRMSTTVANGTVLSASSIPVTGDGTRAQSAPVFFATPEITKAVDSSRAFIGDTLTYTVTLVNTGVTTGTNTIFQDTLPDGLSFVTDSIFVDGVQQTGVILDSVPIGTIPIGEVFTITFKAILDSTTIPIYTNTGNSITSFFDDATEQDFTTSYASNPVSTIFALPSINTSKTVSNNFTALGNVLDYTIIINNTSTDTVLNTILTDTTPAGTSFVANSIKVNGVTAPSGSTLFPTGFRIGTIAAGKTTTLTFKVTVVSTPNNSEIDNSGLVDYNDFGGTAIKSSATNIVTTTIVNASLDGITKSVDKNFATCGDVIVYVIEVPNTGNIPAVNVVIKDTIPNGTVYISNSATVNGVSLPSSVTPLTGMNIGTIPAGGVSTVTFQVRVNCS